MPSGWVVAGGYSPMIAPAKAQRACCWSTPSMAFPWRCCPPLMFDSACSQAPRVVYVTRRLLSRVQAASVTFSALSRTQPHILWHRKVPNMVLHNPKLSVPTKHSVTLDFPCPEDSIIPDSPYIHGVVCSRSVTVSCGAAKP